MGDPLFQLIEKGNRGRRRVRSAHRLSERTKEFSHFSRPGTIARILLDYCNFLPTSIVDLLSEFAAFRWDTLIAYKEPRIRRTRAASTPTKLTKRHDLITRNNRQTVASHQAICTRLDGPIHSGCFLMTLAVKEPVCRAWSESELWGHRGRRHMLSLWIVSPQEVAGWNWNDLSPNSRPPQCRWEQPFVSFGMVYPGRLMHSYVVDRPYFIKNRPYGFASENGNHTLNWLHGGDTLSVLIDHNRNTAKVIRNNQHLTEYRDIPQPCSIILGIGPHAEFTILHQDMANNVDDLKRNLRGCSEGSKA